MDLDLVLYDVNETLSDLTPLAARFEALGLPGAAARTWFASVLRDGFALTSVGEAAPFATLGGDALAALLGRRDDEATAAVLETFLGLDVHPDVPDGLRAVSDAGLRQATLSNGSAAVAESLLGRAGVRAELEALLSVEDAGIWKPAAGAYLYACRTLDVPPERTLMVAVHPWDLHGARRAGLRTAFLDRSGSTPWPDAFERPDVVVRSVAECARPVTR